MKAYTIASIGVFEFQDGIFAIVSGSGAIPTVMTFSIDEHGQYKLIAYEEPLDGEAYVKSIKKMFPKHITQRCYMQINIMMNLLSNKKDRRRSI